MLGFNLDQSGVLRCMLVVIMLQTAACGTLKENIEDGIDPEITRALEEVLRDAPRDALSRNYDPLSLLQTAQDLYQDQKFPVAVTAYRNFLNLHPLHRWAAYAQLKLALSHYHMILAPDRDVEPVMKALAAFRKLNELYPDHPYAQLIGEKIRFCREHLAEHEFGVGHFYYKKAAYGAAATRLEEILDHYPESPLISKTRYTLALIYRDQGYLDKARRQLEVLLEARPETEHHEDALRLLSKLNEPKP